MLYTFYKLPLLYICRCLSPDRTRHKVNDPRVDYSGDLGEGTVGQKLRLEPCWSSTHLEQCGPNEPSWSWTQIWVQARMPAYSLNWTARSSAIQGVECFSRGFLHTWRWPSWSQEPFGLKSLRKDYINCLFCLCSKFRFMQNTNCIIK